MILYQDSLLQLDYDISKDVLYVNWPSLTDANIPYLKIALKALLDAIKHYDIKKLLIDSSNSQVDIPDKDYHPLIFSYIDQLKDTRLFRMARVISADSYREVRLQDYVRQTRAAGVVRFETAKFDNKQQALAWLKE